jgi:trk system potassium uptake protein TrkH
MIFLLLAIVACSFIIPITIAVFLGEYEVIPAFVIPMAVVCGTAALFFFTGRRKKTSLTSRNGFVLVASCWISASIFGSLPFIISGYITSPADAIFESVSGFTTTGASILTNVEALPVSLSLWRCQTHWLGGMGIVALTVAIFPLLGVGGFQLIKAETTGPEKGKITPRITDMAKILWFIYFGLTVGQTILLMIAGFPFVDALGHSFASLGTGGFSMKNTSLGAYGSPAGEWICGIFLFLGSINFSLYYRVIKGKGIDLFRNTEFRVFCGIVLAAVLCVVASILPVYGSVGESIRHGFFNVMSIISTTGFVTEDFDIWPVFAKMILLFLLFIGGCSGSSAGGVKVIRWVILSKQLFNEINRMLHPHGVFTIHLNGRAGRKDIVYSVAAFMFLYFIIVAVTSVVAGFGGADLFSALTSGLAIVGNVGPGFGMVGPTQNFAFFTDGAKWWFSFAMLAGRLELYTMLIFFMPAFWRK